MPINDDAVKNMCKLIQEAFQLGAVYLSAAGDLCSEPASAPMQNPIYRNDRQYLSGLPNFILGNKYTYPVIRKTKFLENYICIRILQDNGPEGSVLIGPALHYRLTEQEINGIINDNQAAQNRDRLIDYYHRIPVIKSESLISMSIIFYYLFNQQVIPLGTVLKENKELEKTRVSVDNPDLEVSKRLQNVVYHHDPLLEKKLYNGIKEGHVEEVRKNVNIVPEEALGVLSKSSYLRSKKNLAISSITVATRAAIDGGLHSEIAYTLSDIFIQRVEELNTPDEVAGLLENALCTFAERVSKVREQRYSKPVTACQNYIFNHLYQEISHGELAEAVKLNPNYLSVLFKKEVGLTVSEYIQKCRIEEAGNLLLNTDAPISEICSWLNFTDQSYFTKIFKKHTGVTPKQFKQNRKQNITPDFMAEKQ